MTASDLFVLHPLCRPNLKESASQEGKAVNCPVSKLQQQQFQCLGYRAAMLEVKDNFI